MIKKFFILALLFCLTAMPPLAAAETARVVTRENAIRTDSRFFAPVRVTVRYQDTVTVLARKGDWFKVRFKGTEGYIHKSALEEKNFSFGSLAGKGGGASADEVALAGKGFNPQVEASFRKSHPGLSFRTVDELERSRVPAEQMERFIVTGGLNTP
jgi:hypothetical protein